MPIVIRISSWLELNFEITAPITVNFTQPFELFEKRAEVWLFRSNIHGCDKQQTLDVSNSTAYL